MMTYDFFFDFNLFRYIRISCMMYHGLNIFHRQHPHWRTALGQCAQQKCYLRTRTISDRDLLSLQIILRVLEGKVVSRRGVNVNCREVILR